ncbi:MAG TPA: ATPase [Thermoplasmata archaeon]|jgi:V/A-type H+-transporting ATPase subunit K|nr:ATPase [Thermoplasmata archaeon]
MDPTQMGLAMIGAGIAIGVAGLGTGVAQGQVGAAAVGATAEDPKMFGKGMILMVLPETIVILGFVVAFLIMNA